MSRMLLLVIVLFGLGCQSKPPVEGPPPLKIHLSYIGPAEPGPSCGLEGTPRCTGVSYAILASDSTTLTLIPGLYGNALTVLTFSSPELDTIGELMDAINSDGTHWQAWIEPAPDDWHTPSTAISGLAE